MPVYSLSPDRMVVPVPTLVSEPPSPKITPEISVLVLSEPKVRFFSPSEISPLPPIEPTVVPALLRPEIEKKPSLMIAALPPEAESKKAMLPAAAFVIVALAAVLLPVKKTSPPYC
jgi:hypothetical protein